ncbi:hypothetical protein ElyMa_006664100 [Elysia marginata]|uniref:G-protein coupled receptors family 1 profile domain-containing protein n=1 Tax=Elysia marginata TaxID=1093978 RepID=A0AAV4ILN1_9GAST|nr:hypothetical protein ElyMa_006664100 [Elysia marginata]
MLISRRKVFPTSVATFLLYGGLYNVTFALSFVSSGGSFCRRFAQQTVSRSHWCNNEKNKVAAAIVIVVVVVAVVVKVVVVVVVVVVIVVIV